MDIQDIRLLYDYNYWANAKILTAAAEVSVDRFTAPASFSYGSLRGALVHTLDAEFFWRVLLETSDASTPDLNENNLPILAAIQERWRQEEAEMRSFLASLGDQDMTRHVRYTNSGGEKRDYVLWHCLVHLVNHGTQHRSEAAVLLTEYDSSPGELDMTQYLNEHPPS